MKFNNQFIKKSFITGLVILLPLALTIALMTFIVNLLTDPFVDLFRDILDYFNLIDSGFLFFSSAQVEYYISKFIVLVLLVAITVLLGALGRWYFFHSLLRLWDYTLQKIPFVRTVYKTFQDVIKTIFTDTSLSFKHVVLVPFPSPEAKSIGFVTNENKIEGVNAGSSLITVFVPTTPNPTSGFLVMFPEEDLVYLDLKVEEAFKYIISCGVLKTPLKKRL